MVMRKKEASLKRNIDRLFQKKNDISRKKVQKQPVSEKIEESLAFLF